MERKRDAAKTIAGSMQLCKLAGIKVEYADSEDALVLVIRGVRSVQSKNGKFSFEYIGAST